MNTANLEYLVCPITKEALTTDNSTKLKSVKSNNTYQIIDGMPNLTYPESLFESDKEFNDKYDTNAQFYDDGMKWLFDSFFEDEDTVRRKLIKPLNIKEDDFILNMGCGTGSDSFYIAELLGKKGKLFNFDLSEQLLRIAKKKLSNTNANLEFILGNGSYLPFADQTFDSVFHFGGINAFSEKQKAIQEMVRVTKKGGRVVFGDEGAAPWLSELEYGKIIKNANPLYKHTPPIDLLPINAQDVSIDYVLGNSFYVISFTVGQDSKLNLDLPIPGKRGGTLRSRYENPEKY